MYIFMSYSSINRQTVKLLVDDLESVGHEVWFDQDVSGGQVWWDRIMDGIRRCDLFVVALSPEWLSSDACSREFSYASALNKRRLPVHIRAVGDMRTLPTALQSLQIVDYRTRDTTSLKALNRALNTLPPPVEAPVALPEPPAPPISSFAQIADDLRSGPLTREKQLDLVFRLKELLPTQREPAMDLLRQLREHPDLLAQVGGEIDELVERASGRRGILGSMPIGQPTIEKQPAVSRPAQPPPAPGIVTAKQAWGPWWVGILVWAVAGVLIGAVQVLLLRIPVTYFFVGGWAYANCLFAIPVGIIGRLYFNRFPIAMNRFSVLVLAVLIVPPTVIFGLIATESFFTSGILLLGMVITAVFEVWRIRRAKQRLLSAG